jgi:hypothetical protein
VGDQTGKIADLIASHRTTADESIVATVSGLDADTYLRSIGLTDNQLSALRERLTGDPR